MIYDGAMDKRRIYHSDPEIMGGVSVFTGTRVPVDSLIAHLKAGDSHTDRIGRMADCGGS